MGKCSIGKKSIGYRYRNRCNCANANTENSTVNVDAIEVDSTACIDAEQNFTKSPWKNRLHLFHSALENFNPAYKYDTIISNPPFFENSILSKSKKRTLARHSASLHYSQVLSFAKNQLTPEGNICLILPFSEEEKCIKIATDLGFFMNRICNVFLKKKKQHRTLLEFSSLPNNLVNETLVIEKEEDTITEEYRSLTKDFYHLINNKQIYYLNLHHAKAIFQITLI